MSPVLVPGTLFEQTDNAARLSISRVMATAATGFPGNAAIGIQNAWWDSSPSGLLSSLPDLLENIGGIIRQPA